MTKKLLLLLLVAMFATIGAGNRVVHRTGGGGPPLSERITAFTPATSTRSDFTGRLGDRFVANVNGIVVAQLDRWKLGGNSGTHTVRLTSLAGTDLATALVNLSGGSSGTFVSATASGNVTLTSGTEYYLTSDETNGGDTWYDEGSSGLTIDSKFTIAKSVYHDGTFHDATLQYYVPVSLRYTYSASTLLSDSFDRTASTSLGVNWTEQSGDAEISSSKLRFVTGSNTDITVTYAASLGSVNQAVRATMNSFGSDYPYFILRYTAPGSPYYLVYRAPNNNWIWQYKDGVGGSSDIQTLTGGPGYTDGDTWGVTITGTSGSTTVRIWHNPTANANAIVSASEWDASSSATLTTTNAPGTPVNTGNYAGVGASQSAANTISMDNFQAAAIP